MTARTIGSRMFAAGLGVVADDVLGEPPVRPHPVAAFGSVMRAVEGSLYRDDRRAGTAHAVMGAGLGGGAGALLGVGGGAAAVLRSTTVATYLAVAGRGLREAADAVGAPLSAGDLDQARLLLPALVGRDAAELDASGIARAVVESLAENTVDALVAPVVWAVLGGAAGALAYRAVNTMDAMVGHRSPRYARYGWAAARLDDVANFVPARITAALVACVRPRRARAVLEAVRTQAGAHPSPNSGVAEAAFAAALGVRLGGTNSYGGRVEVRPHLGTGRPPRPSDIAGAARLSRQVGMALAAVLTVGGETARRRG